MRRQRSPSRVSCRLAVKQQTLGAGWSAYRSNLGTPSRSTHGTNHSECRQRSHGYLRQRVCAHSYGTKTLIQNWWRSRYDESATKTLADPSAGRRDMRRARRGRLQAQFDRQRAAALSQRVERLRPRFPVASSKAGCDRRVPKRPRPGKKSAQCRAAQCRAAQCRAAQCHVRPSAMRPNF